jgi:hypothetical protein
MHNNYHFFRHLVPALQQALVGCRLTDCFSQAKEELVMRFADEHREVWIRASLDPAFTCLSFPATFHRAGKNSIDLFGSAIGGEVGRLQLCANERTFILHLDHQRAIVFKMHGNRSNVIFLEGDHQPPILFRNNLANDRDLRVDSLDRPLRQDWQAFLEAQGHWKRLFPTFGPEVGHYLAAKGYADDLPMEVRWQQLQEVLADMEAGRYYVLRWQGEPVFSVVPFGEVISEHAHPMEGITAFCHYWQREMGLVREKKKWIGHLQKKIKGTEKFIAQGYQRLQQLETDSSYRVMADLLMANLHRVSSGDLQLEVDNFYDGTRLVLPLKKGQSPQKIAENWYRKAKNQKLEVDNLMDAISRKEEELAEWEGVLRQVEACEEVKALRKLVKADLAEVQPSQATATPYHVFFFQDFEIRVGKNARSNDELTLRHSWKDDLWLHARDVSGSHVVVKHRAGRPFPREVIEKAASVAAWYSKRKSDSLCPVIVTPRKFVRKRKGDPAGAVVVDKEEVVLVTPAPMGHA